VTLRSMGKPSQPLMWIMLPVANDKDPAVKLTFDVTGSTHVLRTIQYGVLITPNLDRQHRFEGAAAIGE